MDGITFNGKQLQPSVVYFYVIIFNIIIKL